MKNYLECHHCPAGLFNLSDWLSAPVRDLSNGHATGGTAEFRLKLNSKPEYQMIQLVAKSDGMVGKMIA